MIRNSLRREVEFSHVNNIVIKSINNYIEVAETHEYNMDKTGCYCRGTTSLLRLNRILKNYTFTRAFDR